MYHIPEELRMGSTDIGVLLKAVMDGITDIVGVYKPDHTLVMYNKAGYDFFGKTEEEIRGKHCYEILGRKFPCSLCTTEQAIEMRRLVRLEKYIPELQKCMECSANPVFDKEGKITYIIEQLRDVTEQRKYEIEIRRSKEKYRGLVELSPDAIIVVTDGKIVLANKAAEKMSNIPVKELLGSSFLEYIDPSYRIIARERVELIISNKKDYSYLEYKLNFPDGRSLAVEVVSSYLDYDGAPSMQAVIRDVTEKKREIEWAAKIQANRLETKFPIEEAAKMRTIYRPAQTLSGDFFHLLKVKDHVAVGLLGDVSGKGIAASLSASAVKVLFHEAAYKYIEPRKILQYMNREVVKYLGDEYIAACCFKFDFVKKACTVVSAGIGEYSFVSDKNEYQQKMNVGAFLGMFPEGGFEQKEILFEKDFRFYFYTDGLTGVFEKEIPQIAGEKGFSQKSVYETVSELLLAKNLTEDDCTLLEIKIL